VYEQYCLKAAVECEAWMTAAYTVSDIINHWQMATDAEDNYIEHGL